MDFRSIKFQNVGDGTTKIRPPGTLVSAAKSDSALRSMICITTCSVSEADYTTRPNCKCVISLDAKALLDRSSAPATLQDFLKAVAYHCITPQQSCHRSVLCAPMVYLCRYKEHPDIGICNKVERIEKGVRRFWNSHTISTTSPTAYNIHALRHSLRQTL